MLKWGVISAFDSIYAGEIGIAYYQNPFSFDNMPDLVESEQQKSVCSLTPEELREFWGLKNNPVVIQLTLDEQRQFEELKNSPAVDQLLLYESRLTAHFWRGILVPVVLREYYREVSPGLFLILITTVNP